MNAQLKELETHEFVSKVIYPQVPLRVEYTLTEFGKPLLPLITALGQWADGNQARLRAVIEKEYRAAGSNTSR